MVKNVRNWRGKLSKERYKGIVDYVRVDAVSIICVRTMEFQHFFMWSTSKQPKIMVWETCTEKFKSIISNSLGLKSQGFAFALAA